jgi:16S rRNA processing protein RimM
LKSVDQFLRIARILGPHGLNGRLRLLVITDIMERFTSGNELYLKIGSEYKPFICKEFIKKNSGNSLLKLESIDNRNDAFPLKGVDIYIQKSEAERTRKYLEKDTYYYCDIIGCQAFRNGKIFGRVVNIIEAGEGSILVLQNEEGREFLLPFIHSMVDTKKITSGRIDISPIEGLFEE